ncbi:DNA-binding transcriptional regulator, LysR family [Lentzea fradiae]|uniref:DNA-binding transcriptional regulator, LysR family n=1 Tax=Lentzea fradiae TaxID=200378 RepID=A0A1G7WW60_9PSEU|nr:LysR family transcriptional regulator [Lentzea fradiae]SDG76163.1 DNA-binding transcriptional regulator, LysR family [Lentzea fradiae]
MDELELAPKLAVLKALAADEHVTRAADRVGLPQPTVSRWLAELGERLGAPVVVKSGRRVRLTRAGRLLADAATRSLAALEPGLRAVEEELDPEKGRVVLGFLHMLGRSVVPELVRGFRAEHPHVRFGLVQNARYTVVDKLLQGEIDLALVAPPPDDPAIESVVVFEQELIVVVPAAHPLAAREDVRLADLVDVDLILLEHGYGLRQITDDMFARAGLTPRVAFESQEIETVRGLVAAGLGVAVLTRAENPPQGLRELPLTPRSARVFGLAWLRDHPQPPAVRAFREHALRTHGVQD